MNRRPKSKPQHESGDFLETIEMDWEDFAALPDNPMQRDTIAHARRVREYIRTWKDRLAEVGAYRLPSGDTGKSDGHSRVFLWKNDNEVEKPPTKLRVSVYYAANLEAAGRLLQTYDHRSATHQSSDELYGVLRYLDVDFQSPILREGKIGGGLRIAQNFIDPSVTDPLQTVRNWLRELRLFDTVMATRHIYTVAFFAGAMLLLRRYGDDALPFLIALQEDLGDKDPRTRTMNAQEAFNKKARSLREEAAKRFSTTRNAEIARTMVAGYNAVEQDKWFDINARAGHGFRRMGEKQFQAWLKETREKGGNGGLIK